MADRSKRFPGLALALCLAWSAASSHAAAESDSETAYSQTAEMAAWVLASGDNGGLPFAIVDKLAAEVAVFGPDGVLRGVEPALIGSAHGDDSTPDIGKRKLSDIKPEERTTPAGRFLAAYGPAYGGRKVLWVDFETAISLHPVVTANRKEKRLVRLASPTPEDNRITYGCINVSAEFYEKVVRDTFKDVKGVVYVLPETRPAEDVFPGLILARATRDAPDQRLELAASAEAAASLSSDAASEP